ncbi:MAG: hydroxymethylbilane synthase [Candidatus Rifleibacteriota bacterium]
MKLRVGTRGSKLALHQTRQTIELIKKAKPDLEVEEVIIKTLGDKVQDLPLFKVGGQGLFIKAIENALLENEIDLAVHSLKDVPHEMSEGLELAAFGLPRDPRDCLLSFKYDSLQKLPSGSLVGTSSLRRRSLLAKLRPDLKFSDYRGNLDTRLRKLEEGQVDAVILAAAGLARYNQQDKVTQYFETDTIVPPAGQGIIAVQCRQADLEQYKPLFKEFSCKKSTLRAICERAFLKKIQGGCQTPMAIHAKIEENQIVATSFIGSPDGSKTIFRTDSGPLNEPEELGIKAADAIIAAGGLKLLNKSGETEKS